MEKEIIKVKSSLSEQTITLTVEEKFDSLNPKDFAPEKLDAANKVVPEIESYIRR